MVKIKNKGNPKGLNKRWLSVREVMAKEGLGKKVVYNAIWKDIIPAKEVVSGWLIDTQHDAYLAWVYRVNEWKEKHKSHLEKAVEAGRRKWAKDGDSVEEGED